MGRRYPELIRIVLAEKVEGHRMNRMDHLYGPEDQTVCEPKACRIKYATVAVVKTQGFYGRIKGGNVIAARGPTWESDVITDLAWMPCRSAPSNVDMYGAATL